MSIPSNELEPPTTSTASKCVPPRNHAKSGGTHSSQGDGVVGGPNLDDWIKSLVLCLSVHDWLVAFTAGQTSDHISIAQSYSINISLLAYTCPPQAPSKEKKECQVHTPPPPPSLDGLVELCKINV
jgi:hypothetical protein